MKKVYKFSTESEPFEKFYQIQIWILTENTSCNVNDLLDAMTRQVKIVLLNLGLYLSGSTSLQVLSSSTNTGFTLAPMDQIPSLQMFWLHKAAEDVTQKILLPSEREWKTTHSC